jgi:hypothetical protein
MKQEEEKKEGSLADGDCLRIGEAHLPKYFLPQCVSQFCERDAEKQPFQSDDDYFFAVLACESARLTTHRLRGILRACVLSPEIDTFACPSAKFFGNGRELSDVLADLTLDLDNKREAMVASLEHPPLIEKFLTKMEAHDAERKVFRHVLVRASGTIPQTTAEMEVYPLSYSSNQVFYSVSVNEIQSIFSDDWSLAELMSLADFQSPWVEQRIYERCIRTSSHLSAMSDVTIRAFAGSEITVEQYQNLESATLQDTLLEHEPFKQTQSGQIVLAQQISAAAVEDEDEEDQYNDDEAINVVDNPLAIGMADALASPNSRQGKIFDIIGALQQEEAKLSRTDPDNTPESDVSEQGRAKDSDIAPYRSEMDYLEDQIRFMDLQTKVNSVSAELNDGGEEEDSPLARNGFNTRGGDRLSREEMILERSREAIRVQGKLKKLKEKLALRLRLSKKEKGMSPRLEQLCEALKLCQFERFVILDLIRMIVKPFQYDMDREDGLPSGCVAAYVSSNEQSQRKKYKRRTHHPMPLFLCSGFILSASTDREIHCDPRR